LSIYLGPSYIVIAYIKDLHKNKTRRRLRYKEGVRVLG
jgi:hypothetical protein